MEVLVIDCRTRGLAMFAASVTRTDWNPSAIILRHAAEVGWLTVSEETVVELPILVMGGYSAQSSAGHVTVLGGQSSAVVVVGGCGFGRDTYDDAGRLVRQGDGLRPFALPVRAYLLPAGSKIVPVRTHGNSNVATAAAALRGLEVRSRLRRSLIVCEGQSDCIAAWEFQAAKGASAPELPTEHRSEIFYAEELVVSFLRYRARRPVEGEKPSAELIGDRLRQYAAQADQDIAAFIAAIEFPRELLWLLGVQYGLARDEFIASQVVKLAEETTSAK